MTPGETKLIGVGNRYRGDDGVGLEVIRQLGERLPATMLQSSDGELTSLLDLFAQYKEIVIIDALNPVGEKREAGEILHLNPDVDQLGETGLRSSTHAMGVAEAIDMARTFDSLPDRLRIIGIVGNEFNHIEGLSPAVQRAADQLTKSLLEEFEHA